MTIDELFGTAAGITPLQECARAVLIFGLGLLLVRVAGRRIFSRWGALDIIVAIVLGSNFSRTLTGNAPLFGTLAANVLLVGIHWVLARAAARWPTWSRVLEGTAVPLVQDGRVDQQHIMRHGMSRADLGEALRSAGVENERAAALIVLEPSGKISVLKRSGEPAKARTADGPAAV